MKKSVVIFLIIIMILSSLGLISAITPVRNHTNSAQCYNCNDSSQCYCDDNCLCKDPNYIQKIGGVNKIRNNDSCYRCNETCYCPDNCSCKQPYSQKEIKESKEYMNYENNFFVKTFRNTPVIYVINIIYVVIVNPPYPDLITGNGSVDNGTINGTNTTVNGTVNNTTIDNSTNTTDITNNSDTSYVNPNRDTHSDDGSNENTGDSESASSNTS